MDFDRVEGRDALAVVDEEREAAVVVPVIEPEGWDDGAHGDTDPSSGQHTGEWTDNVSLLFTERADHLSDHPGQMSFPGGGREPEDADLRQTALREANEEIGLDPRSVSVVGRLDDIRTVSHYSVRPFVSRIPDQVYYPSDGEVAEIVVLSLTELIDHGNYESERRDHPYYGDVRLHFFDVDGSTVWGATAKILVQFLQLTTGWEMPPEPDRIAEPDDDLPESVHDQLD